MHKDKENLEKATFNTARDVVTTCLRNGFQRDMPRQPNRHMCGLKEKIRLQERYRKSAPRNCRRESTKHALNGRVLPFHGSGPRTNDRRRSQSAARNPWRHHGRSRVRSATDWEREKMNEVRTERFTSRRETDTMRRRLRFPRRWSRIQSNIWAECRMGALPTSIDDLFPIQDGSKPWAGTQEIKKNGAVRTIRTPCLPQELSFIVTPYSKLN